MTAEITSDLDDAAVLALNKPHARGGAPRHPAIHGRECCPSDA